MNAIVQPSADDSTPLLLDLGCGKNKKYGFLGVDRRHFDGVDGVTDLTAKHWVFAGAASEILRSAAGDRVVEVDPTAENWDGGWKLADSSVTEVHCSHFLEHLNHNTEDPARVRFMNELYRVLVPGGKATIITPHWASNRAYGDFTHADKPVSEMFYYYVSKEWREANAPDNDVEWNPDGYTCDFSATWGYGLHPEIIPRNQQQQTFALTFYKEAAADLHATLVAKK